MDKKLKAKWVKALRSGKYKQGRIMLMDSDNAYCCLGVLEEICGTPKDEFFNAANLYVNSPGEHGLDIDVRAHLANMNDGIVGKRASSFKQIANWIEKNL